MIGKRVIAAAPSTDGKPSQRLEVKSLHHVSVVVDELDRSKRFYRDVLGMRPVFRPDFGFPGLYFEAGSTQVHLIPRQSWHPTTANGHEFEGVDACHFALEVSDGVEAAQMLEESGVEILQGPEQNAAGWVQLWFRDPDGYVIEFVDLSNRPLDLPT